MVWASASATGAGAGAGAGAGVGAGAGAGYADAEYEKAGAQVIAGHVTVGRGAFIGAGAVLAPEGQIIPTVVVATLVCLAGLGALGAKAGGAALGPATLRVLFWGAAAMAITAGVGRIFGVSV